MVEIRWLGAAGLEIALDGKIILVDPLISRPGKFDVIFRRLTPLSGRIRSYTSRLPGRLEAVICGHTHFDHALDIPSISLNTHCSVVGSSSLKALMEMSGTGSRMITCRGNEDLELAGGFHIHMIPSRHGGVLFGRVPYPGEINPDWDAPLKANQYRLGSMFMPKIEAGGITLVHAGSANYIESEAQAHRCDILFMCVPGWKAAPGYTEKFLKMLNPEVIIPFHFDDFTAPIQENGRVRGMPMADLGGFVRTVREHTPGAVLRIPNPHEVMRF